MTDPVLQIVNTQRGEMSVVHTVVGGGFYTTMATYLPMYGVEYIERDTYDLVHLNEAAFVEFLNEVRLLDKLLFLSVHDYHGTERAFYNIQECFLNQGGRAVIVDYTRQRAAA